MPIEQRGNLSKRPGGSPRMIIYNLFPLLAGPFSRWTEHIARAAGMGFDWIYVNPIQQTGASRSLYSIVDQFRFNPALLDPTSAETPEAQVRQAMRQAHERGLRVMIDLVVNHCASDAALPREHPEWFVRGPDGRVANASCSHNGKTVVWRDLAQFDHRHTRDPEGLYRHCAQIVDSLLALGFDGFRCDAAYQVPAHVWSRLIGETKRRHPQMCFVAETLGCSPDQTRETARAGFDFIFNSSKWWNFHDGWLIEQAGLLREVAPSISFPESHDTARLSEELNGNVNGLKQRYLFAALFSEAVMMPMGFEYGLRKRLDVVHTTPADWQIDGIDLRGFVEQVNGIKRCHPVFREPGPVSFPGCHNPNVLLLKKSSARDGGEALLILNKDPWHHQEFYTDHFGHFLRPWKSVCDVSPEHARDTVPQPFHYGLRPGQGIVLVTGRD